MLGGLLGKALSGIYSVLGREKAVSLTARGFRGLTRGLAPAESLRFLLALDQKLYDLQGEEAVRYGGGIHTKHRHLAYHDFFTSRIGAGETVLDIGCGNGALAYDVATRCPARVTAIDINGKNIDLARRKYADSAVAFVKGDATRELPGEPFDVVILSNVLEHIDGRVGFLEGIQESTKASRILVRVPLFERDWRVPLKKELDVEWRLDPTHVIEYTQCSFLDEIRQARLEPVHIEIRWGEIWSELCPSRI